MNFKKAIAALSVGAVVGLPSIGITATSAPVQTDAAFVPGIAITVTQTLDFGTTVIATGGPGGTITITPDAANGTYSEVGDAVSNSGVQQAEFTVQGTPNTVLSVITPPASILLPCVAGACLPAGPLSVNPVTILATNGGQTNGSGLEYLALGGTISFGGDQSGVYQGSFTIDVDY